MMDGQASSRLFETVELEHVPQTHMVHIALFRSVSNAEFLRGQLLARNPEFEYAFIDASTIISRVHLLAAVFKAVSSLVNGSLRTPNVHSEIVISLSASNSIADAYRRFGLSPATKDILVVKVLFPQDQSREQGTDGTENKDPAPPDDTSAPRATATPATKDTVWDHLTTHVQGSAVSPTDDEIAGITDWAKVRKYYKLGAAGVTVGSRERSELVMLTLGAMALRGL